MRKNTLVTLVVIAVGVIAAAVFTSPSRRDAASRLIGKPVFNNLPINDVEMLRIASLSSTATLARTHDAWVAPEKYSYPADFDKIRKFLVRLSELKIGQMVSLDESQKRKLGIVTSDSTETKDRSGTFVTLYAAGNREIASIILGEMREKKAPSNSDFPFAGGYPDGRYISPDKGKTVYLVSETFSDISSQTRDWLETEILNVSGSDVQSIVIRHPDKPELKLSRAKEGSGLTVDDLADDEETDSSKLYSLESALSYLRFADVADPALPDEETGLDNPKVFEARTKQGQIFTAHIGSCPTNRSERYVRFNVSLAPFDTNSVASADTNALAKAIEDRKKLEDETSAIKARLSPWIFLIEAYKADYMLTQRDAAVKKKEAPKEAKEQEEIKDAQSDPVPGAETTTDQRPVKPDAATADTKDTGTDQQ